MPSVVGSKKLVLLASGVPHPQDQPLKVKEIMIYPNPTCPFCTLDPTRILTSNTHAFAIMDGFPISPGHALIIPKRHIASLFEAAKDERDALFDLVEQVRQQLLESNPSRPPFLKGRSAICNGLKQWWFRTARCTYDRRC